MARNTLKDKNNPGARVYGPYLHKKQQRYFVLVYRTDGTRRSLQYAKWLLEQEMGRELSSEETVDHIDRNCLNDDLSNLRVVERVRHSKEDCRRVKSALAVCVWCLKEFQRTGRALTHSAKQGKAGPFCGKSCAGKYGAEVQNGRSGTLDVQEGLPVEQREYYFLDKK